MTEEIGSGVIRPDSPEYDAARQVWNAMVDRRPELVVRCATPDDVASAIRHARDNDLEISVRCGGHSVIGHAIAEGGLVIDLRAMDEVTVDPATRRAHVKGGALLGALDRASLPHGLATTAGNVSHTGVGGLTLGGGMGWLARQHGLTCDNVISFEVVTADGQFVRASAEDNPDLFWGLRGGGGNFGVVTDFEFRLHEVTGPTTGALFTFPLDAGSDAMRVWRDLAPTAPRQCTLTAWVGDLGDGPLVNLGFIWVGETAGMAEMLDTMRSLGPWPRRSESGPTLSCSRWTTTTSRRRTTAGTGRAISSMSCRTTP